MTIKKNFLCKYLGGLAAVCGMGVIGAIYVCNRLEQYNVPTFDAARFENSKKMLAISIEAREIERTAAWDACMKSVLADPETKPLLKRKQYYEDKLAAPESLVDCLKDGIKLTSVCDAINARADELINQLPNIREIDNRIRTSRAEVNSLRRDSIEYNQWLQSSKIERAKKNWALMRNRNAQISGKYLGQLVH